MVWCLFGVAVHVYGMPKMCMVVVGWQVAELTDERNWRSGLRVRLLLRRQVCMLAVCCFAGDE